jgi:alpha 1,2-mannosyltransferase
MFGHAYAGAAGLKYLLVGTVVVWTICHFPNVNYTNSNKYNHLGTVYTAQRNFTVTHDHEADTDIIRFWQDFAAILHDARPQIKPIKLGKGKPAAKYMSYKKMIEDDPLRVERLNLSEKDEDVMYYAHRLMRDSARTLSAQVPYRPNTHGIVMTAGTKLMPILLVSLRLIRRSGTTLPIEVWLGSRAEYDRDLCQLLTTFNAQCRIISDIYEHANAAPLTKYQFKIFSILFSSYENVMFLDADSFPINDPTSLLTSEPYISHGLVTWPDTWASTTSASYYAIADIPEVPVSTRISTESGQLLINKRTHSAVLLMSVYYNYYGPDHYYKLLSQGSYGAGDKETFLPAAMVMDAPFYQVKTPLTILGRPRNGKMLIIAMAQHHPTEDWFNPPPHPSHQRVEPPKTVSAKEKPKILFIHHNVMKLDPREILRSKLKGRLRDKNGDFQRMWVRDHEDVLGRDVEKEIWQVVREEACRTDEKVCGEIGEYFEAVFGVGVDGVDDQVVGKRKWKSRT